MTAILMDSVISSMVRLSGVSGDSHGQELQLSKIRSCRSARVMRSETGQSRGFGFVSFQTPDQGMSSSYPTHGEIFEP